MFFLIWWLLIVDCVVDFKIVHGNERVIITVPVHIKKMHHTKMIYKIIEKPVLVDAVTPSSAAGQDGHKEPATPDAPRRPHGDGNQTLATYGYRDRGGGHGPPPLPTTVDQRGRGYGGDYLRGPLRDGDPSRGPTAHYTRVEGVQRGPQRHVDKYGSYANGVAQHPVHDTRHLVYDQRHPVHDPRRPVHDQRHPVHDPRHPVHDHRHYMHGHHAGDLWHHDGGHSFDGVVHGHFGDVMHVGNYEQHGHFNDHKHEHLAADNRKPVHSGGHRLEHFGGTAAHSGGEWRAIDTSGRPAAGFRGQNQYGSGDNRPDVANLVAGPPEAAAHRELRERGFPQLLHDRHRFSNSVYGNHVTGGYQVQENVADYNGVVPTVVPPPRHPAADQISPSPIDHNFSSPMVGNHEGGGGGDTLDGMSSVSAISSPPTVSNVYYTLDPVVPYA